MIKKFSMLFAAFFFLTTSAQDQQPDINALLNELNNAYEQRCNNLQRNILDCLETYTNHINGKCPMVGVCEGSGGVQTYSLNNQQAKQETLKRLNNILNTAREYNCSSIITQTQTAISALNK